MTIQTVRNYTDDLRADEKEKRDMEILDLYLQCYSYREIAEKLGITKGTISNVFKNGQMTEIKQPTNLQYYNVWSIRSLGDI